MQRAQAGATAQAGGQPRAFEEEAARYQAPLTPTPHTPPTPPTPPISHAPRLRGLGTGRSARVLTVVEGLLTNVLTVVEGCE